MYYESLQIRKRSGLGAIEELSRHFPGGTEENYEIYHSEYAVSLSRF
jgi:hypothetical protein